MQQDIRIEIIRSKRKTIAIEIKPAGTVLVRAPYLMKDTEIYKFINEKEGWITKHLEKVQKQRLEAEEVQKLTMEEVQQLADCALKVIPEKVRYYAEIMDVHYGRMW